MDLNRIKNLLKYALSVAGLEDPGNQELVPIHLVKYVYLGDLSYAEAHGGETFTNAPWVFYSQHFQGEYEELRCRQDSFRFEVTARFPEYPSLVSLQFLRKKGSARGPHQGLCLHPVIGRLSGC